MTENTKKSINQKCLKEVSDFEEKIKNKELNVLFLHDDAVNPKHPYGGKYNYQSYDAVTAPENANRNLGIGFPKTVTSSVFWCGIDIDGDTKYVDDISEKDQMKEATRRFLFEMIKSRLEERGIKAMYVKTANNGFHIYLKITQSTHKQHGYEKFLYPGLVKYSLNHLHKDFMKEYPILGKVAGKRLGTKSIEVFTQGAYLIAPGSEINGRKYELLPDGAQTFDEVSTYGESTIQELLEDILISNQFDYSPKVVQVSDNHGDSVQMEKHDLEERNIKSIGELMLKGLPLISGEKHDAILSLGGFLSTMNVSEQSIIDIGNYIIDNNKDPTLFSHDDETERTTGLMTTLLHDIREGDGEGKAKRGLTYLKKIFEGIIPLNELSKVLWLNSRPSSHSFYPDGTLAETFYKVKIDFEHKKMQYLDLKRGKWNEEKGEFDQHRIMKVNTVYHSLDNFEYIDDLSSRSYKPDVTKKKLSFVTKNEKGELKRYIFEDTEDMLRKYPSLEGAHGPRSQELLKHIVNEYERIGLIVEIEGSSKPGIYLSRDGKTIRKFITTKNGVEEVKPEKPDKSKLINALKLLSKVNEVYPWEGDKFGVFVKLGLILPYGYMFKNSFNDFFRGIILYGEAGTLKSTAADLIEHISVPRESRLLEPKNYITSGSDLRTEYRIGRALDRHSYPIIVNESEGTFSNVDNRELIKNAISDIVIREPGGDNPQTYYARAIPILTANELPSAVETSAISRRFLVLNFLEKERGDTDEVIEKMQFLNENGIRNSRFTEFEIIGDFVYYTLSKNIHYFHEGPQKICDNIIRDMEQYTGLELNWLSSPKFDKYQSNDREDEAGNEIEMILDVLKKPFTNNKKRFYGRPITEEQILEEMIGTDYSYIYRVNSKQSNGVLIGPLIKNEVSRKYPRHSKSISQKRLAELINSQLELSDKVHYAENKMTCTDGTRRRGVYIEWEDFCSIMNVKKTKNNGFNIQALSNDQEDD